MEQKAFMLTSTGFLIRTITSPMTWTGLSTYSRCTPWRLQPASSLYSHLLRPGRGRSLKSSFNCLCTIWYLALLWWLLLVSKQAHKKCTHPSRHLAGSSAVWSPETTFSLALRNFWPPLRAVFTTLLLCLFNGLYLRNPWMDFHGSFCYGLCCSSSI